MERDCIFSTLKQHQPTLHQLGVQSMWIFGSVARNEAHAESDVDVLVDLQSPLTFDRYMNLKLYLEDLLEQKIDLVTRKSLKPQLREIVEQEAIRVA